MTKDISANKPYLASGNNCQLKSIALTFSLPLRGRQISRWRGAFIEMAGWKESLLHNHDEDTGLHYRYPQVQYRAYNGKAGIFAINQGVEAMQRVLSQADWTVNWNRQQQQLQIEDLRMYQHQLTFTENMPRYQLKNWIALNGENYKKWQQSPGMVGKAALLQRLLENHLMACLWSLGWSPEKRVVIQLENQERVKNITYHGNPLVAFDMSFSANIELPNGLAIGKGVSHGFGTIKKTAMANRAGRK